MAERLGFVGIGRMGSEMAKNMMAGGEDVIVFDIDEDRVADLVDAGADSAGSVTELVDAADIVFTSLPKNETVEAVYFGDDGILESLTDGMAVVEMSTVKPETVRTIQTDLEDRGLDVDVVDCPVIGIPSTARDAELTVLVGATDDGFERLLPYLDHIGTSIEHVGEPGRAKAIKLVNNVVTYGNYALAAEVFALAEQLEIGREELFEIIDSGAAQSSILASKLPNVLEGSFEPGFTVEGALKDLEYALELGHEEQFELPVSEMVAGRYRYAVDRGHSEDDYSILMSTLSEE
ncbi:NAD(P)-dependent oxidoreductase [Natrinema longum]|uniref:NAD(P)-dependent oxidoreductase n=1 Tax=Natrinema longum TaxID=370324 RepID=UPI001CCB2D78|nr:NAD(P)-dependent oxidoreductase [Natrinema longum]MBZ6496797.1 NAD(P)-dependent oxidoreductase [Natrinema longum]